MIISAIISTFNAKKFFENCLIDLIEQSVCKKSELEIVIIDSGSEQKESEIINIYRKKYDFIKCLRTEKRETLYQAWNRGIELASGKYITNANTDDRHDVNCLEKLVDHLENFDHIDLVYGKLFKSNTPNESYNDNNKKYPCPSQTFFPGTLLLHNYIGAQPVWRKSLHSKIGYFDESFKVVGDYEFMLRAASTGSIFSYVPEASGLMLRHENALSTQDQTCEIERDSLLLKYRSAKNVCSIYEDVFGGENPNLRSESFLDLGIRALCYFPQFSSGSPQFDFKFARKCFDQLSEKLISQHNKKTLELITNNNQSLHVSKNVTEQLFFYGSSKNIPTENELKATDKAYLHHCGKKIIHGKLYQMYMFDLVKFYRILFAHIDLDLIVSAEFAFVWGVNERGKYFGSYLKSRGQNNVHFIDYGKSLSHNNAEITDLPVHFLTELSNAQNIVFILAMSSHHWKSISRKIKDDFPKSTILYLDNA